jgi:hypothetical protein
VLLITALTLLVGLLASCKTERITAVHGWIGPEASVHVDRSGAVVTLQCPTAGWTINLDRATRTSTTATLYLTLSKPTGIVAQAITPIHLTWNANGEAPTCVQAMIRADDKQWLPAAEGCR